MVQPPPSGSSDPSLPMVLHQRITGSWVTQALYVAAAIGIADRLADGARHSDDLAREAGCDPASLYRLLRALGSIEVLVEGPPGAFRLTPLGACLQRTHPQSMHEAALMYGGPAIWAAWGGRLDGVRSGGTAFERVHGMGVWQYRQAHPDEAATFNTFMARLGRGREDAFLAAYDFTGVTTLVDVAGGSGTLLAAIVRTYPEMCGILFDLPQGLGAARDVLAVAGVIERCSIVAGDMFEAVPAGGDAYLLSSILHDWDDARASAILANCHRAMQPGGRIVVQEFVVPDAPASVPPAIAALDLTMLALEGGRERTVAEFRVIFEVSGFELTRVVPVTPPRCVIEGMWIESPSR